MPSVVNYTTADTSNTSPLSYRQLIDRFGAVLSYTQGHSMRPLIFQGKGYVGIVAIDEPHIGDILLFEQVRNDIKKCILHRLIKIDGDKYIMRGDNNLFCEIIKRDDIIGKAEEIYWIKDRAGLFSRYCWMPMLLNAKLDRGVYSLNVNDKNMLKYARFWNSIWPARRIYYRFREIEHKIYRRLKKLIKKVVMA